MAGMSKAGGKRTAAKRAAAKRAAAVVHIEQETTIKAPAARVFEALTKDLGAWWGAPYLTGEDATDIVLEPRLGGQVREVWGPDRGQLWATVTGIRPPEYLELTGPIGMGGAVAAVVRFTLEAKGSGTVLRLSHRVAGEVTDGTRKGYSGGWKDLLGSRLKAYVETGKRTGVRK